MSTEQWWVRAGISWAEPSRPELKRRGAGAFQFSSWNWAVNFLWHITFLAENFFFLAFTNFCISHFLKRKCVIHYKKELKCKVFWKSEWQKVPNLLFLSWNKIFGSDSFALLIYRFLDLPSAKCGWLSTCCAVLPQYWIFVLSPWIDFMPCMTQ